LGLCWWELLYLQSGVKLYSSGVKFNSFFGVKFQFSSARRVEIAPFWGDFGGVNSIPLRE